MPFSEPTRHLVSRGGAWGVVLIPFQARRSANAIAHSAQMPRSIVHGTFCVDDVLLSR